jgi:hypothetical protein
MENWGYLSFPVTSPPLLDPLMFSKAISAWKALIAMAAAEWQMRQGT